MPKQDEKKYPDNNPKTIIGLSKPGFHAIPAAAFLHLGKAMEDGRRKYGIGNWRTKQVTASVYLNAKMRHTWSWWDGEDIDPVSLVTHLGHDMACDAILLDAIAMGKLIDDRPPPGTFAEMIRQWTESEKK